MFTQQAHKEQHMSSVIVAYHSGYGHTQRLVDGAVAGAASVDGISAQALDVSSIDEAGWALLAQAGGIIFATPTYMGGVSAQFKTFADASAKVWFAQGWKDKIAGGMTVSGSPSGEKQITLQYLAALACQHSMIWVSTGMMPGKYNEAHPEHNRLGSAMGVMAEADNAPADVPPPEGDIETARLYGKRVAELTLKLHG